MIKDRKILAVLLLGLIFSVPLLSSQTPIAGPQNRNRASSDEVKRDRERAIAMNKDRVQRIKRDSAKLLELATELKQYVDKTNENVLSIDVIRKADEIDKLAKSIREKMKEDYRPADGPVIP